MNAVDATGVAMSLSTPPRRIVSLVPSLTETLFAFGAGGRVAGVTRFCEEPAERVRPLPKVGGTKTPDIGAIMSLKPDLVVASVEENREPDVAALRSAGITVYVTHYPTVQSAIEGISELGRLVGTEPEACGWLTEASAVVASLADKSIVRPVRYFCSIWRRPYMVARRDTYMADLLALAGGVSAYPEDGPAHYFAVELDTLPAVAPEVILLPDEPYPFARKHLADFTPYRDVPAVRDGRISFIDGKALTWYGPRTAKALYSFAGLFDAARIGATAVSGSRSHAG